MAFVLNPCAQVKQITKHRSLPDASNTSRQTHTTVLRLSGFCPGQPGRVGTRINIHPLTPIMVINHPLSACSIYYDPWPPPCLIYVFSSLFPQFPSKFSLVYFLDWHPALHITFLHPIIVFFSQHITIPLQPVSL